VYLGFDCRLVVFAEGKVRVVHDGRKVVGHFCCRQHAVKLFEVVLLAQLHVLPKDLHVLVTVVAALLVEKSQRVHQLVNWRAHLNF